MSVVRAPVVTSNGTIGVRGWRAHCPTCRYLGEPKGYRGAESELARHRKAEHPHEREEEAS